MKITKRPCAFCGKEVTRKSPGKHWSFCNMTCKAEFQKLAKPVTKEWLIQKYVVEMLTADDIAIIVNRDPKSVWNWLKDFGIPTRSRGSYERYQFPKGVMIRSGFTQTQETKDKIRKARLLDGHVPYLKNGVHHLKGKRGAETPNWKGGVTPERQSFYATDEWKLVVKEIWQRDNAICQRCGLDHRTVDREKIAFHIHHITSFGVRELRCELSNLVLLCGKCHRFVHSRNNTKKEFLR